MITRVNVDLTSTRTILKDPIPALFVLDGTPLYEHEWDRVQYIPPVKLPR